MTSAGVSEKVSSLPQADQDAIGVTLIARMAGFRERDAEKLVGIYSSNADWVNAARDRPSSVESRRRRGVGPSSGRGSETGGVRRRQPGRDLRAFHLSRPMSLDRTVRQNDMEATNLADLYELPPVDWAIVERRLAQGVTQAPGTGGPDRHTSWLATINPDGSPHVTGVGALWYEGAFWFETGEQTRKGRNLARDPRCTLSVATHEFDLVIEGVADKVTDPSTVATMAGQWNAGDGQPEWTTRAGRSPLSTAPHRLDLPRGRSTASGLGRQPRS